MYARGSLVGESSSSVPLIRAAGADTEAERRAPSHVASRCRASLALCRSPFGLSSLDCGTHVYCSVFPLRKSELISFRVFYDNVC